MSFRFLLLSAAVLSLFAATAPCQQAKGADSGVSIVQPGAPGHSNKTLTPETASAAPRKPSEADIKFMQGMIMHHGQAVEMTDLLRTRSQDKEVQALGAACRSPSMARWTWQEWIWPAWIIWTTWIWPCP
jgi:uncharacterized protein (DUF305 family)